MHSHPDDVRPPRFVVGIDLGTTNSAVAYFDTTSPGRQPLTLAIDQLVAPGEIEARQTLPSFHYEPAAGELGDTPDDLIALPWGAPWRNGEKPWIVGALAKESGARVPGRLVASAKSWLSHSGVDRAADLLPLHGAADVTRVSPGRVTARYLAHIRAAWDQRFPDDPLDDQSVVVTIPASFDEIARELTVEAARTAGLPRVVLLEEPQAAFYAWISSQGEDWNRDIDVGERILVCDVGGGTTDLSLIEIRKSDGDGDDGVASAHRVAVGDHLILGGDNMDLTLAHHVEGSLEQGSLGPEAWGTLVRQCQRAKEILLGDDPPASTTLSIPTGGSRIVGDALRIELGRDEVVEVLVDGFFPEVPITERPRTRTGFQEFGLPYAPDTAVTRYTASFLADFGGESPAPDFVLLNGGAFESPAFKERFLSVVAGWGEGERDLDRIHNDRLDLAVSQGAAYFGLVRLGQGVRISGGLARSYYVGLETKGEEPSAVCLIPAGLEAGERIELERNFKLRIRQPAEFPLFVSALRTTDSPGDLVVPDAETLRTLPPLRTTLKSGKKTTAETVRVRLTSELTEVGTLEIRCAETDGHRSWRLEFDARAATRTDAAVDPGPGEAGETVEEETVDRARALVRDTFASKKAPRETRPEALVKRIESATELDRWSWPPTLLREIWSTVLELAEGRRRSETHEARWLNLLGWSLRPGYGMALDDWRVSMTWRFALSNKVDHPRNELCRAEWWILWRRIAGGLAAGQQRALAEPLVKALRGWLQPGAGGRRNGGRSRPKATAGGVPFLGGSHETAEIWRLLAALEWLDANVKIELGDMMLEALDDPEQETWTRAGAWALGRLGGRQPQYGPLNTIVPIEVAERWLEGLLRIEQLQAETKQGSAPGRSPAPFFIVQLARRTGDRYRDIGPESRARVVDWLRDRTTREHFVELIESGGSLDAEEQQIAFGESLPVGIRLA